MDCRAATPDMLKLSGRKIFDDTHTIYNRSSFMSLKSHKNIEGSELSVWDIKTDAETSS